MRRLAVLVLALALTFTTSAAAAEKWWEAYDRGVAAVNNRNYAAAAQALQKAISEMPSENGAARGKEIFVYVPHFWLGIAKFNLGDVDGALREFKISEDQGVVQNTRYYAGLRDWLSRVQVEKQKASDAIATQGKKEVGAVLKTAVSAQMEAVQSGGDRTESYRAAQRRLQEARDVSAKAGTDLREYRRAAEIAAQSQALFAAAVEEGRKLKSARTAAATQPPPKKVPVQAAAVPPAQSVQPATPPPAQAVPVTVTAAPRPVTPPAASPAALSAVVADARVAVQQYRRELTVAMSQRRGDKEFQDWVRKAARDAEGWQKTVSGSPSDEVARNLAAQVTQGERELAARLAARPAEVVLSQPAPTPTVVSETPVVVPTAAAPEKPVSLEQAWTAYAGGDLRQAEKLLTNMITVRPSAEAYLLRGCSRYSMAMLSKSAGAGLAAAEADFRKALELNRRLRLDAKSFSPKLVDFFDGLKRR